MNTSLKASLEKAIGNWAKESCEGDDWPEVFVHPEFVRHMTNAAEAVFDATTESSLYTQKETEHDY